MDLKFEEVEWPPPKLGFQLKEIEVDCRHQKPDRGGGKRCKCAKLTDWDKWLIKNMTPQQRLLPWEHFGHKPFPNNWEGNEYGCGGMARCPGSNPAGVERKKWGRGDNRCRWCGHWVKARVPLHKLFLECVRVGPRGSTDRVNGLGSVDKCEGLVHHEVRPKLLLQVRGYRNIMTSRYE